VFYPFGVLYYSYDIRCLIAWLFVNAWLTVLGCADIPGPENSWTRRHDNTMTIFCRDDETRYHVVCQDGRWTGRIGSCSNTNSRQGSDSFIMSANNVMFSPLFFCLLVFVSVSRITQVFWDEFSRNFKKNKP